ncbi:hypothetical protein BU16DRAFT_166020 [Lophium mytilinum]|uniref:Zn(2)-C6 fungal-type domain-containing protein n=1 Tax=Lophium mytilinum TaxID=390894 RepID=A0A6A6QEE9_9PEZI|nr:hypothetical protein BU16DRAFT_166020 [Lophium mytilinum]
MVTESSDVFRVELPKRTRRAGSKVRTGCLTCKIRRVKCDEKKPCCSRCTSTGRKCDGYPQDTRDLQFKVTVFQQLSSHRPGLSMLSGLGDNVQYLEFYHSCARSTLSSHFDNEFWSRISLQLAQSEPAIRHALIALGYLYKTQSGNLRDARTRFAARSESKILLLNYNKAVKHLADRMIEPSYTAEVGLVTCVLFICIEYMRGNWATAFMHLTNGLNIIAAWRKTHAISSSSGFVSPQSSPGSTGSFSSSESLIEEKLVPIYVRSITAALMYGVPVEKVSDHLPADFEMRPFPTILEAQASSHELRNLSLLFIRDWGKRIFEGDRITEKNVHHQNYLLDCHYSWLDSLQTLERDGRLSKEDRLIASQLKVSYYATLIFIACVTETSQMPYDQHLRSFKALCYHARLVLESMGLASPSASPSSVGSNVTSSTFYRPAANFTFEVSIVPPLFFCANRCRCPVTRREAIALLALNPPREGLWDPQQNVVIAERAMEIEESEVDPTTGWPVDKTRLYSVVIDGNMDGNGRFSARFSTGFQVDNFSWKREERVWVEWFILGPEGTVRAEVVRRPGPRPGTWKTFPLGKELFFNFPPVQDNTLSDDSHEVHGRRPSWKSWRESNFSEDQALFGPAYP